MKDGMDKIRKKGGPKEYKTAPRLTGRERLKQSALLMYLRVRRKGADPKFKSAERTWALAFAAGLKEAIDHAEREYAAALQGPEAAEQRALGLAGFQKPGVS